MSDQITTARVQQYSSLVQLLSQQLGSRLKSFVRREPITGKAAYYDQIGSVTAVARTTRHGDTPLIETPHSRRQVTPVPLHIADLIDEPDRVRALISPEGPYARTQAAAIGRAQDLQIIAAASGSSATGEAGGTAVALPSTQKVAHGAAGLTLAKLLTTKEILDANDVDPTIPRHIATSARQVTNMLGEEKLTSADYASIKALVRGDIDTFLGFQFHLTQLLTLTSNVRYCLAWAEDGLLLAEATVPKARISERDDKNYSTQVYYEVDSGATRMEEDKVVEIACSEA